MAKSLVIVESPAKARTITRYLGRGYTVKASLGHVKDLPRRRLGVDVDNHFRPTYFIIRGKEKVVAELRQADQKVDSIYLAADPDREGEAICAHLREVLIDKELVIEPDRSNNRGKKKAKGSRAKATKGRRKKDSDESSVLKTAPPVGKGKKIYRVAMNEITPRGVRQAFANPAEIDSHLVDAQQARRILDRLVGYEVSPLLWDKVKRGLSAGRVQTVAVRLVVEREQEIRAFVPIEYWSVDANLGAEAPPGFDAKLIEWQGRKLENPSQDEGQRGKQFYLPNEEEAKKHVAALQRARFRVESVQQKERRRYPVPPFTTSKLQQEAARKLRFSVKRTMMLAQRLYEGVELGEQGSVGLITYMRTDSTRVSQDALAEVRELIPQRFGADYLPNQPRFYKSRKGAHDAHQTLRPPSLPPPPRLPRRGGGGEPRRNDLKPEQHFTQSPPRYTEATLVKELEEKGIGRPSTYAAILTTILEREYVRKDKGRFFPSPLGELVTSLLIKSFEDIFDVAYTARMEEELDEIEEGKLDWRVALREFYEKFARDAP